MYQYTSNITNLDKIMYSQTNYDSNHSQSLDIINTNLKLHTSFVTTNKKLVFSKIEEEMAFFMKQFTHIFSEKATNKHSFTFQIKTNSTNNFFTCTTVLNTRNAYHKTSRKTHSLCTHLN